MIIEECNIDYNTEMSYYKYEISVFLVRRKSYGKCYIR